MNLSSFSANDFEPVKWINESFKQNEDKEKFASDTVLKLRSFIQEINRSLEDSSKKIIVNLGKVKGELCTLNEHACTLKSHLDNVQSELSKIQIENDAPTMSKLLQISELQSRMQETSMSPKEADNWTTLSREMESVIQKSDLDVIASKLICMQKRSDHIKNLNITTGDLDYLERMRKLNEFKAIFIQAINPKLSSLFSDLLLSFSAGQKRSELEKFVHILKDLNKIDALKEVHQESICHQLVLEWQKTKNLSLKDTIIDFLNTYFDLLNVTLVNQTKIIQLFTGEDPKECCDILVALYIDLFNKIGDDLNRHLNEFVNLKANYFTDLINSLIHIKTLFDKLTRNVYNHLIKINPQLIEQNSQSKQLFLLINTPYKQILRRYFTIEQEVLQQNCNEFQNTQFGEYATKTFQIARDCEHRCYLLTNSVYLPKFIGLIELSFNQSIDYFETLKNSIRLEDDQRTPDWNLFQTALFYLQSIGDFVVQFDCFQQQIFNSWLDLKNKLDTCEIIIQNFSLLYLNVDDQNSLHIINIKSSDQLFAGCLRKLETLCNDMLSRALSIPINFVTDHLDQLQSTFNQNNYLNLSHQENEEVYSLTPNEYITQIGQYLLTIPQHIEHLIVQENISLKCVFKHFNQKQFLLTDQIRSTDDVAEFFLTVLVEKIVQLFIKKIQVLNLNDRKDQLHLIVDCEYLNEVIDDLGLSSCSCLNDLIATLKSNLVVDRP